MATKGPRSGTILQGSAEGAGSLPNIHGALKGWRWLWALLVWTTCGDGRIQVAVLISPFASIGKAMLAFLAQSTVLSEAVLLCPAINATISTSHMDKPAFAKV